MHNSNFQAFQHLEGKNLRGLPYCIKPSLSLADLEAVSDGEPPRGTMPVFSSSDEESIDSGEETDCQNSEAFERSQEEQMEGLEDIKALFNEDQERSINTVEGTTDMLQIGSIYDVSGVQ